MRINLSTEAILHSHAPVRPTGGSSINSLLNSVSVYFGLRPAIFPSWGWYSAQFFDGTAWTGFTTPLKSVSGGSAMLQGTYRDAKGQLYWMHGTAEPLATAPSKVTLDDGTTVEQTYATAVCFTLEGSAVERGGRAAEEASITKQFTLWAIAPGQSFFSANGLDSEGGVDIFAGRVPVRPSASAAASSRIGYGNLEGVGWLPMAKRLQIAFSRLDVADDPSYAAAVTESVAAREVDTAPGKRAYALLVALLIGVLVGGAVLLATGLGWAPMHRTTGPALVLACALLAPCLLKGTVRKLACGFTHTCLCNGGGGTGCGCGGHAKKE